MDPSARNPQAPAAQTSCAGEQDPALPGAAHGSRANGDALKDYHQQLPLLEQQIEQRLQAKRADTEAANKDDTMTLDATRGYHATTTLPDRSLTRRITPLTIAPALPSWQWKYAAMLPHMPIEQSSLQSMNGPRPKVLKPPNTSTNLQFTGINDLTFMEDAEPGSAQMTLVDSLGKERTIHRLDLDKIKQRCPLLASAFEEQVASGDSSTHSATYWCDMKGEAPSAVIAVLRWIYIDDYTFCEAMIDTQVPLLLHFQVLHLAQRFEASKLEVFVQMKIEGETADASKTKEPIPDLCEAVRYLYTNLRECEGLRRLIASYTMSNLEAHLIREQEAFRQTVYQSPLFHRDLIRANFEDNFTSPMADVVIKMPVCKHEAHSSSSSLNDFSCEFHTDLGLLCQASQAADYDVGANKGQIKPANLRRKFSFDKDLEHSKDVNSPKRARQQSDRAKNEGSSEEYQFGQQRDMWPAGTMRWPPTSSYSPRQFKPLEKNSERAASELAGEYKGFAMNAERYKRWEASVTFRDRKPDPMTEQMPEGQFVDAFEWPNPVGVDADPQIEAPGLHNEASQRQLTVRNPDVETPSDKLRPSAEPSSPGSQLTNMLAATTSRSGSVLKSDQAHTRLLERFTSPVERKPAPKTSMLSEMRRNTQLSSLDEAFEDTAVSKDVSIPKQKEVVKPTLANLLNGSSAYSRGSDTQEHDKPEVSPPDWEMVKIEDSQASNPLREDAYEMMDLSSDEDWENVDVSESKLDKGKGKGKI